MGGIDQGLELAQKHLSTGQGVYGGPRVADLSSNTQQGMSGLANNEGYGQSADFYKSTLDGDYLDAGNPYIGQVQQAVQDSVMPGINSTFGGRGMAGSTIHQNQLAQGLSNGMAGHLFANYENERGRQMSAAGQLPAMYGQQARDQLTAGGMQDQQNQNILNADMAQFEEQRRAPIRAMGESMPYLMNAGRAFGENTGRTESATTNTSEPSMFSTVAGAGMMAAGAMTGNPMLASAGSGMLGGAPQQAASFAAAPSMQQGMMGGYGNYYAPPPVMPQQIMQPQGQASYGYGGQF